MVQPGSGSGKMPITIGSVEFTFFEGKQARYMKHRSAALFVAKGFAFGVWSAHISVFKQNYQTQQTPADSSEKPGGAGAAIAAAASVGYLVFTGWAAGGGICPRGARLAMALAVGVVAGVVIFFAARTVMAETA